MSESSPEPAAKLGAAKLPSSRARPLTPMVNRRQPSLLLSTAVVVATMIVFGYTRLFIVRSTVLPLTLVLPLLLCVWTRQRWQLWGMSIAFVAMAAGRAFWILPLTHRTPSEDWIYFGNNLLNVSMGAAAVLAIMAYRDSMDEQTATISARNEEIGAQSVILARQNERIELQSRELAGQNQDLRQSNERLRSREAVLEMLLQSSRALELGAVLDEACHRGLQIIGAPAVVLAIYELKEGTLLRRAESSGPGGPSLPPAWPADSAAARLIHGKDPAPSISMPAEELGSAGGLPGEEARLALLASPLRVGGATGGLIAAGAAPSASWTEDQVRIIEWLSAQCSQVFEIMQRQAALAERSREIEAANSAKDNFIAMLSHELRTPLTPVLASVSALVGDERLPAEVRADLEMIEKNVAVQSRLIDDLLDLTRITRGRLELADPKLFELATVIRDSAAITESERLTKGQGLSLSLDGLQGCLVRGDGARLQQVFWNLLRNAIKFSPAGARIAVTGKLDGAEPLFAVVEVVDTGIGILAGDLDRIFLPFEQVVSLGKQRGSGSRHGMGLGLGLGIAKAIVELHGGRIRVESEGANRGSTFVVRLPAVPKPAAEMAAGSNGSAPEAAPAALRVLLVEDHGDTSRAMSRLLRRAGHTVETAETVAQAMEAFERGPFDLLVSDLGLPDESGLELMRRAKLREPALVGICLSGYGTEEDLRSCREAGFAEHLTKPVDMARLNAAVARMAAKLGA